MDLFKRINARTIQWIVIFFTTVLSLKSFVEGQCPYSLGCIPFCCDPLNECYSFDEHKCVDHQMPDIERSYFRMRELGPIIAYHSQQTVTDNQWWYSLSGINAIEWNLDTKSRVKLLSYYEVLLPGKYCFALVPSKIEEHHYELWIRLHDRPEPVNYARFIFYFANTSIILIHVLVFITFAKSTRVRNSACRRFVLVYDCLIIVHYLFLLIQDMVSSAKPLGETCSFFSNIMNSTQWMHALCMICMINYCYIEEYHLEVQNLMIIAKLIQRRRLREFNYAYRIREYSAPTWYLIIRFGLPCGLAFIITSAVFFGYTALPYVNWLDFMVDVCYIPTTTFSSRWTLGSFMYVSKTTMLLSVFGAALTFNCEWIKMLPALRLPVAPALDTSSVTIGSERSSPTAPPFVEVDITPVMTPPQNDSSSQPLTLTNIQSDEHFFDDEYDETHYSKSSHQKITLSQKINNMWFKLITHIYWVQLVYLIFGICFFYVHRWGFAMYAVPQCIDVILNLVFMLLVISRLKCKSNLNHS